MSLNRTVFVYFGLSFLISLVQSTEFVPCYMWSTQRSQEKVPALRKISQDSFKDDILEQLKHYDFIVVFAEETISPEDFAQRDQSGFTVFTHLDKYRKTYKTTYLPYVQSPIKALKHLGVSIAELPASSLTDDFEIPKTEILIINLNDAEDSENRIEMLKRHDALVGKIYKKITNSHQNVLALYTAYHESWVASEDIINARRARSLLQTKPEASNNFYDLNVAYLYVTEAKLYEKDELKENVTFKYSANMVKAAYIQLDMISDAMNVSLGFNGNTSSAGYWEMQSATLTNISTGGTSKLNSSSSVYALKTFSYHCGDQIFLGNNNLKLLLKDFQIELLFNGTKNDTKFSDAYDCVGFTSVPIWSGIFVTAILLLILSFGITMMMDIRTMDRFDDSKGKTITINAAE